MRKWTAFAAVAAAAALLCSSGALADGTETLGSPSVSVATGTDIMAAGVGLEPYYNLPSSFSFNVPGNVKQVLLYWQGHWTNHGPYALHTPQIDGDSTISINGTSVTGTKIGGSTGFFTQDVGAVHGEEMYVTYRADITSLGLVGSGSNTLTVNDMDFESNFLTGFPFDQGNDGAGVMVIYDDGTPTKTIGIRDGNDLAFYTFAPPLNATVPQTFSFAAAPTDRLANLATIAGSLAGPDPAAGFRTNQLKLSFNDGASTVTLIANPWQSNQGFEFDAKNIPVTVPAGASTMTAEAVSGPGPASTGSTPASLDWSAAALSVPKVAAALGDFVWNDVNMNGVQDAGEPGIPGLTIKLYSCGGTLLATQTTDSSGLYLFSNLAPGSYKVQFGLLTNYQFSPQDQGADAAKDSDANTATAMTGCYTLAEGETNRTVDAGMFTTTSPSEGTATGYGIQWPGTNNWFMYTPYTTAKLDLVSGRKLKDVGDIFMSRSGTATTIRIVLASGWTWATMSELVKIHPMDTAPTDWIQPGHFRFKFTPPNLSNDPSATFTLSGNTAIATLPGISAKFYGIHTGVVQQ